MNSFTPDEINIIVECLQTIYNICIQVQANTKAKKLKSIIQKLVDFSDSINKI